MNTPTRVVAFVTGLAAVFGAAVGVGTLTGPVGAAGGTRTAAPAAHGTGHTPTAGSSADQAAELPGGLTVSQDGYTLTLARRQLPAAANAGSPDDANTKPGPGATFYATAPSAGDHRLFLDFRHNDQVRTAAFTVTAAGADAAREPTPTASAASASASKAEDGHSHGG